MPFAANDAIAEAHRRFDALNVGDEVRVAVNNRVYRGKVVSKSGPRAARKSLRASYVALNGKDKVHSLDYLDLLLPSEVF